MHTLKLGAMAVAVAMLMTAIAFLQVDQAAAQSPAPSETENAVINCGDSISGHGGSADNPPTCVNESGEEVSAVVVVEAAQHDAQNAPSNTEPADEDGGCSSYKASGYTESWVRVVVDGKVIVDQKPERRDYAISGKICVDLSGGVDAGATGERTSEPGE